MTQKFDALIIGTGQAGPPLAARLSKEGMRVAVVENTMPGGWPGTHLHHHAFDEGFYVLEGELTFQVGDEVRAVGPGGFVFARGGEHHAIANRSDAPARYLLVITPAGFERYFDRLRAEATGEPAPPEAAGPVPESFVVGPRIGERG